MKDVAYQTAIDPAHIRDAITDAVDRHVSEHPKSALMVTETTESGITVRVHDAMHPQKNTMADITWEAKDGGNHVHVAYRHPREGEVTPVSFMAPILACLTIALFLGAIIWGIWLGILCIAVRGINAGVWVMSPIAPAIFFVFMIIRYSTARAFSHRRFKKMLEEMFA